MACPKFIFKQLVYDYENFKFGGPTFPCICRCMRKWKLSRAGGHLPEVETLCWKGDSGIPTALCTHVFGTEELKCEINQNGYYRKYAFPLP